MPDLYPNVAGVVLAGGKSLRMGSDKARLPFEGGTFLEKIVDSMTGVFAERLVIGRLEGDVPSARLRDLRFAQDVRQDCGPLGGMYTALLLCKSSSVLFVSCDAPLIDRSLYAKVCDAADPDGRRMILVETSQGKWGNFPVLIPKTYLRTLRRLLDAGERSVRSLLQVAMTTLLPLSEGEAEKIHSINTPRDYETLVKKHHALVA